MERVEGDARGAAATKVTDWDAGLFRPFILYRAFRSIDYRYDDGVRAFLCLEYLARQHFRMSVPSGKKSNDRTADHPKLCRMAVTIDARARRVATRRSCLRLYGGGSVCSCESDDGGIACPGSISNPIGGSHAVREARDASSPGFGRSGISCPA